MDILENTSVFARVGDIRVRAGGTASCLGIDHTKWDMLFINIIMK